MSKEELIILKYINEYKELPTAQVYKHFQRVNRLKKLCFRKRSAEKYSNTSIYGCLWYLCVDHDYIRMNTDDSYIQITDRGEIEAYSYIIERHEIWKNRLLGFFFGIATSVIATLITTAIKLLLVC